MSMAVVREDAVETATDAEVTTAVRNFLKSSYVDLDRWRGCLAAFQDFAANFRGVSGGHFIVHTQTIQRILNLMGKAVPAEALMKAVSKEHLVIRWWVAYQIAVNGLCEFSEPVRSRFQQITEEGTHHPWATYRDVESYMTEVQKAWIVASKLMAAVS